MSEPVKPGRPLCGHVPVIDLAASEDPDVEAAVARQVRSACRISGAFVVVGHGIPQPAIRELHRMAEQFFTRPAGFKRQVSADPLDPLWRGFTRDARGEMFAANRLGEPEAWCEDTSRRSRLATRNKWPEIPGFQEACLRYYTAASALSLRIMRLCALALGLDRHWFDAMFQQHMTPLLLTHHSPDDPAVGDGPHPDLTALTVRCQDHTQGRIQVRRPGADWMSVPYLPGSLLVTLGRLMARWTNDRWVGATHRVVKPPGSGSPHLSTAFCYHPDPNAVIECVPTCLDGGAEPRYRPVVSAGYFIGTTRRAMRPVVR